MQIIVNYDLKWQLKFAPHYQFTDNGICINTLRGKIVRKVVNGGCKGYCIKGKFISCTKLRKKLVKIEKTKCHF